MKIAYTKVNLANDDNRARLIDDLIQHVEGDEVARQYLEDIQQFMDELIDENDYYIRKEKGEDE